MKTITNQNVKDIVCNFLGIDISDKIQQRSYVYGRFMYYDLCKTYVKAFGFRKCGEVVNKNHSTVFQGITKFNNEILPQDEKVASNHRVLSKLITAFINGEKNVSVNEYISIEKQLREKDDIILNLKIDFERRLSELKNKKKHRLLDEISEMSTDQMDKYYSDRWVNFKKMNL